MPVIAHVFGVVIKMYYQDHAPPHFHAEEAEKVGVFRIKDLEMIEGNLSSKTQKAIIEWAEPNQTLLQVMWDSQKIEKI